MKEERNPFFSIIIPTYNRGNIIKRTIHSVLSQIFSDFELIIVDDGSTDNTEEVVMNFKDQKIRYFRKENGERGAARNYGADKSNARYLNFFDSDDIMYPNHLQTAHYFIKESHNPEIFHLAFEIIDEHRNNIEVRDYLPDPVNPLLISGNHLSCNGVFIRKDIFMNHRFNEDRKLAASEDYELWLRLGSYFPIHSIKTVTSGIVQHAERSVVNINAYQFLQRINMLVNAINKNANIKKYFHGTSGIISNIYMYAALHFAMAGFRSLSLRQLSKSLIADPKNIFSRKIIGVIKNLVF